MKFINKFSILKRLIFAFAIVILFYIFNLINNIQNINDVSEDVNSIYNIHLLSIDYLIEADRDAYQVSVAISQAINSMGRNNSEMQTKNITAIEENMLQIEERYNKFSEIFNIHTHSNYASIDSTFRTNYKQLNYYTDSISILLKNKNFDAAEKIYYNQYAAYFEPMRGAMDQFTEINLKQSEEDFNNSMNLSHLIKIKSLIIFVIILIIIILSAIILTQSINKPLQKAVVFSNNIAAGDLTQNIKAEGNDETAKVLSALQNMITVLRKMVLEVKNSSSNVYSSSSQITKAAQDLSNSANEQAVSTEEITSSIEEMVATINQNADNAQQTEKLAISAVKKIKKANESVSQTVEAMKRITEKISVINDIASKTDLLAVNAAIEAARAGSSGRGFAIVAEEVRKLAIQSQEAALSINELSHNSMIIATQSGVMLGEAIPDIESTSNLIQEISQTSVEQNSGANQINTAVIQLAELTQRNSASSEELASNAEELSGQSALMNRMIEFFKTTQDELDAFSDKELEIEINKMNTILKERKKRRTKSSNYVDVFDIEENTTPPLPNPKQKNEPIRGININLNDDDKYEAF